jgi:hypothetical protein
MIVNNSNINNLNVFANLRSIGLLDDNPVTAIDEAQYSLIIDGECASDDQFSVLFCLFAPELLPCMC